MSPVLAAHFADYAAFHRTAGNQVCHYLGIPMIVLSLIALLAGVPLLGVHGVELTLAEPVILVLTAYYARLDAVLALVMLAAALAMDAVGRGLSWPTATGLFVVGWIFQFIGHYAFEHRAPAFLRNFVHLLVGPLWILAKALGRA